MKFLTTPNLYGTRKAFFLNGSQSQIPHDKFSQHDEQPKENQGTHKPVQDEDLATREHTPVDDEASQGGSPIAS